MKELVRHIEFLINQNNCVIVPGLGGFVLNYELAHVNNAGLFLPPRVVLGFNADLKHNDGLLCKSYSQYSSISYDAAASKINYTVKQIKISLQKGKQLSVGKLGDIVLSEGNVVFIPSTDFIYPSAWGYSALGLKQLEITKEEEIIGQLKTNRRVVLRRVLVTTTSAAAALALFFIPLSNNSSLFSKVQQSGFFSAYTNNLAKKITDNKVISEDHTLLLDSFAAHISERQQELVEFSEESNGVVDLSSTTSVANITQDKPVKQSLKTYYIIVGGDPHKKQVNRLLEIVHASGFKDANIVETADRYRIYVASFTDKVEANNYLDSFRQKNPSYADAWLFTKRN